MNKVNKSKMERRKNRKALFALSSHTNCNLARWGKKNKNKKHLFLEVQQVATSLSNL